MLAVERHCRCLPYGHEIFAEPIPVNLRKRKFTDYSAIWEAAMTIIARTENPFPNVPHPLGACWVADWVNVNSDSPSRYFEGTRRAVDCRDEQLEVCADGIQRTDGSVEAAITVIETSGDWFERLILTSEDEARGLARALLAAADEYDRMR
jgi:hypothetical protein